MLMIAALIAALLTGTGSKSHAHPSAPIGATGPVPARAPRQGGNRASAASAEAGVARRESRELRRLVAFGLPIYCAANHGDEVALTFDDGPGPYTRLVIAKLRKHSVGATFFVVGRNIALIPGVTRQERALGAVGDHTFSHPLLTSLSPAQSRSEIVRTQRALSRAAGGPVSLFRPPYGARNASIDRIARTHGLLEVMWSVDSRDSLGAEYAQIERNVIAGLHGGAIVLMHENHGQTVRALLGIFAALQRRHLRAVSVPQLLTDDPPRLAQVRAGGRGCGLHAAAPRGGH